MFENGVIIGDEVRKDGRKGKDETDDNSNSSNPFPRSTILQRETFKEEKNLGAL